MVTIYYLLGCLVMPTVFTLLYLSLYFNWNGGYCDAVPDYIGATPEQGTWFVSASSVPQDRSIMISTGYVVVDWLAWVGHSIRLTALYYLWGAECYILCCWKPDACIPIDPVR